MLSEELVDTLKRVFNRLNPCSIGICSLSREMDIIDNYTGVLILVLLEYAL